MKPSRQYQFYGWLLVVAGVVFFVAGFATLLDPSAERVRLGAFLIGPFLAAWGLHLLRTIKSLGPLSDYEEGVLDAEHPAGLRAMALDDKSVRKQVVCEGCGKEYVYFPSMTPQTSMQYIATGSAAAPCPRCGRVQKDMFEAARMYAITPASFIVGLILLCVSALFFCYVMAGVVTPAMQHPGEEIDMAKYWIANGLIVAAGAILTCWGWRQARRWDPNSQALTRRLAFAHKLALPLESYHELRSAMLTQGTRLAD